MTENQTAAPTERRRGLPRGTPQVGVGLVAFGLANYGYLAIAARELTTSGYATLATFWGLVHILGTGVLFPLDQELSRGVSARRARGLGRGSLVQRGWALGLGLAAVLAVGTVAFHSVVEAGLAADDAMVGVLALALVTMAMLYLTWGTLGGNDRFATYGASMFSAGVVFVVMAALLALAGVGSPAAYALCLPAAHLGAVGIGQLGRGSLGGHGPSAHWGELTGSLGTLIVASLLSQVLINSGVLLVAVLAPEHADADVGRFLGGLVLTRIPVFLFAAVHAALLPELTSLASRGERGAFAARVGQIVAVLVALGGVGVLAFAIAGPSVLEVLFGNTYRLGPVDCAILAGGAAAHIIAMVLAQALIALGRRPRVAGGWAIGVGCLAAVTAMSGGLLHRVETGYLAGMVGSMLAMAVLAAGALRATR